MTRITPDHTNFQLIITTHHNFCNTFERRKNPIQYVAPFAWPTHYSSRTLTWKHVSMSAFLSQTAPGLFSTMFPLDSRPRVPPASILVPGSLLSLKGMASLLFLVKSSCDWHS